MIGRSVLLVGNFLSKRGTTRTVSEELAERLTDAGWSVVTTSDEMGRLARLADMIYTTWKERERYDVAQVDVYSGLSFIWAEAVCWLLRVIDRPYVLTLHGGSLPVFGRRWPRRVTHLLRSADVVTTPAPYLREEMARYRADIVLLRNAIDLNRYEFRLRENPRPRLIWLRAFHSIYNPSLVPRVLALLIDEYPEVRVAMVGPDKGDGSLGATRREAHRLGVTERIDFVGVVHKTEVPKWLADSDIFLNTTNVDSIPVSVVEAMACGLCVISTNVGGMPYLVDSEQDGILVEADRQEAMAQAVRHVIDDAGTAPRLSANGRKKAELFTWQTILPEWEQLLEEVASGD